MGILGEVKDNDYVKSLRGKVRNIPKVDATLTKGGYAADAKTVGDYLKEKVDIRDIIDDFNSEDPEKVASARTVFVLAQQIANMKLSDAGTMGYNNANSGLSATNMQSAIDEVAQGVKNSVSKNGESMVEGTIHFRNADNGYGSVNKNNSDTEDYGMQIIDRSEAGKFAFLSICGALDTITYTGNDGQVRDVYHEGNKPFSSYEGNGIDAERIINTNGIGRVILVYNKYYFSFVTPQGALVVKLNTGSLSWIDGAKVYFLDGKLGLHTANAAFNEVDETYYYQVL